MITYMWLCGGLAAAKDIKEDDVQESNTECAEEERVKESDTFVDTRS